MFLRSISRNVLNGIQSKSLKVTTSNELNRFSKTTVLIQNQNQQHRNKFFSTSSTTSSSTSSTFDLNNFLKQSSTNKNESFIYFDNSKIRSQQQGLFSKKSFETDQLIFIDNAFSSVVENPNDFCGNCLKNIGSDVWSLPSGNLLKLAPSVEVPEKFKQSPKIKKCSDSSIACRNGEQCKPNLRFCSPKCENEAWEKQHDLLCSTLAVDSLDYKQEEGKIIMLVADIVSQIVHQVRSGEANFDKIRKTLVGSDKWEFLKHAVQSSGNASSLNAGIAKYSKADIQAQKVETKLFFDEEYDGLIELIFETVLTACIRYSAKLDLQIEELMMSVKAGDNIGNAIRTQFQTHGIFLPKIGSFVQHSCEPNTLIDADYSSTVNEIRWIAKKPIREDEELTISFVPLELPHEERKQLLQLRNIECQCPRCQAEQ